MMFGTKTRPEPTADNYALAYAQRRSWVMWSWMYGALLTACGTAFALASVATGTDPETGTYMAFFGAAIAALGWLVSAPQRFTRKIPKPAMDLPRAEQAIRINKGIVIFSNIVMVLFMLALAFGTPKGLTPETIPILALISVCAPLFSLGLLRTKRLLVERGPRYERWLQGR